MQVGSVHNTVLGAGQSATNEIRKEAVGSAFSIEQSGDISQSDEGLDAQQERKELLRNAFETKQQILRWQLETQQYLDRRVSGLPPHVPTGAMSSPLELNNLIAYHGHINETPAPLDAGTAALFQGFSEAIDNQMAETRQGMEQILEYYEQEFGEPLLG